MTSSTHTTDSTLSDGSRPLVVVLSAVWHGLLAAALAWLSFTIYGQPDLMILGEPAELGKPVQYFAATVVLIPAVLAVLSTVLMLTHNPSDEEKQKRGTASTGDAGFAIGSDHTANDGRYLGILVNFSGFSFSLFALLGVWGVFQSFEPLVDMILANGQIALLGVVGAYALFWMAGRFREGSLIRTIGERLAMGIAGLTLMYVLLTGTLFNGLLIRFNAPALFNIITGGIVFNDGPGNFNIVTGMIELLSVYVTADTALNAWVLTIATGIFGYFSWSLLHLRDHFGETPDQRAAWQGWFMLAPNILGFMLFFAGPLLLSFYISFTNDTVGAVPEFNGLENYIELMSLEYQSTDEAGVFAQNILSDDYVVAFSWGEVQELDDGTTQGQLHVIGAKDRLFWISLRNTLLFCAFLLPLAIIPAVGMALVLNSKLPGVKFFRAIYFLPSVAAVVGTALIWRWLYTPTTGYIDYSLTVIWGWFGAEAPQIGWLNDPQWVLISIVILAAWQVVGYNTVLVLAGLQGIPNVLYEAAQIDGANRWNQFWNVTIPMLRPTLFFVFITTMVTGLQVFNEPYTLFPAQPIPENATTSVYYMYRQGFQSFNFGYASSVAWILFIIIFSLTLLQFRFNGEEDE